MLFLNNIQNLSNNRALMGLKFDAEMGAGLMIFEDILCSCLFVFSFSAFVIIVLITFYIFDFDFNFRLPIQISLYPCKLPSGSSV